MHRILKIVVLITSLLLLKYVAAQEINVKVTVLSNKISTKTDKKVFNTLQTQLTNFLNNRKWTGDDYKPNEKIECAFLLNLNKELDKNVYSASLTIQAARPIYNTTYNSPLINFQDNDITFKYIEYDPIEFNESRVSGSDALKSNLTAIMAYYVYFILGMDYDSFSQSGGETYYKKMLNIVNSAPEGRDIKGWTQFDGLRNRYWLAENATNAKYTLIHNVFYEYYRASLDKWYDNEQIARQQMFQILNTLNQFANENRNTMITQVFIQGKSDELIKMFKKSLPDERVMALELLQKIDVTNANKYRQELQ